MATPICTLLDQFVPRVSLVCPHTDHARDSIQLSCSPANMLQPVGSICRSLLTRMVPATLLLAGS